MIKKVNDFRDGMIELMDIQWNELDVVLKQINVKH